MFECCVDITGLNNVPFICISVAPQNRYALAPSCPKSRVSAHTDRRLSRYRVYYICIFILHNLNKHALVITFLPPFTYRKRTNRNI